MNGGRSLVGERLDEAWGSVDLQLTVTISFKSGEPRGCGRSAIRMWSTRAPSGPRKLFGLWHVALALSAQQKWRHPEQPRAQPAKKEKPVL